MSFRPKQFGIVLKNARIDKNLTQAELAEKLNISLSYLKDLERFRNNPSYELLEKVIHYFNLSADIIFYPMKVQDNETYKKIEQLLSQCDEAQLQTALLYIKTLLSKHEDYINQNNNSIMD